ncbi:hypothetical protein PV08_12092 [Exophiala spinifera]|uniref:Uncharacterized protein n=1 Tax=Exophiala spinifera TaxID=91928 RepID=A0A0D2BE38_9EURO|nr:uncharacterized protein PV08_12092 [Exophiala spinifera]KIW09654.1 hypothetical protein PV08_12092 [Exophiala spinifera]
MSQRHCSKEHHIDTRRRQKERLMYRPVILQCFFAKPKATDYWIVRREDSVGLENDTSHMVSHPVTPAARRPHHSHRHHHDVTQSVTTRFHSAIQADKGRYQQLGEPNHVSEITPWLRKSAM